MYLNNEILSFRDRFGERTLEGEDESPKIEGMSTRNRVESEIAKIIEGTMNGRAIIEDATACWFRAPSPTRRSRRRRKGKGAAEGWKKSNGACCPAAF